MMQPILECNNLTKSYGKITALDNFSLSLMPGQIVGLLGPNGSGKSTLIKLINGLLIPNSGEILVNGRKPGVETKTIVSYLPDKNYLDDKMKITEIVTYFSEFYKDFNVEKANSMLADLKIDTSMHLGELSKGTKEKVQLILVMSRDAMIYILDEPIGGVDSAAREYILNTIISNYNENATILLSTHLISDIENVLERVLFIKNGVLELDSTVDQIREENGCSVDDLFREVFRC